MSAIEVEILGTGCKKCQQLAANAKEAIAKLGIDAEVIHITDVVEITKRGVMSTPAFAVNKTVISQGQIVSPDRIQQRLQELIS
ncbi:thioredoxin family protein [Pseudanabaena sp. PCC 6802]|uniref:thioredoxin family protein n=1 Tax=Pseudanabaena sp. PCC 6802 TaxID=118173 RepID=UPI000349B442|nr:thioredoxin family protein [Pseudanabaena sp. PCC 6802]